MPNGQHRDFGEFGHDYKHSDSDKTEFTEVSESVVHWYVFFGVPAAMK